MLWVKQANCKSSSVGEREAFPYSVLQQLDAHKAKAGTFCAKINSRLITDLNVEHRKRVLRLGTKMQSVEGRFSKLDYKLLLWKILLRDEKTDTD